LPYVLTYSMLIGSARRVVETAAEAALAYQQIRKAGGSLIAIADDTGNVVTMDELEALLAPSPTVLVVEDDALVRFLTCSVVEEAGYAAVEARDADQAIAILEQRQDIRLVFTDIDMPGTMDGLKLAHYVRDRWPPIHLLLVSGKSFAKSPDLPAGALFMPKPYGTAAVISTLRQILR
jgi:CheY-like chemotaxis protein